MPDTMRIRTVQPAPNLTEQVAKALADQILKGPYEPGQALPSENVLATNFGVSRTVLREALARLRAEGLIFTRQGRGLFVAATQRPRIFQLEQSDGADIGKILQIVELRMGFETEAAGLAAQRRTEKDLESLRRALADMESALGSGDVKAGSKADMRFHETICAATGNPHYTTFFTFLSEFLQENIHVSRKRSAAVRSSSNAQAEHRAIYEAIAAGDTDAARAAARAHIEMTACRLAQTQSPPSSQDKP